MKRPSVASVTYEGAMQSKQIELTLYIAGKLAGGPCGTVKLNKLLFFADALAYGKLGHSITGAQYIRQAMGPVMADMVKLRKHLVSSHEAHVVEAKVGGRHTEDRLCALRPARTDVFSPDELAIADYVVKEFGSRTGKELSALSHKFAGWHYAKTNEPIPLATIFLPVKPLQPTAAQRAWAESVLAQLQ